MGGHPGHLPAGGESKETHLSPPRHTGGRGLNHPPSVGQKPQMGCLRAVPPETGWSKLRVWKGRLSPGGQRAAWAPDAPDSRGTDMGGGGSLLHTGVHSGCGAVRSGHRQMCAHLDGRVITWPAPWSGASRLWLSPKQSWPWEERGGSGQTVSWGPPFLYLGGQGSWASPLPGPSYDAGMGPGALPLP